MWTEIQKIIGMTIEHTINMMNKVGGLITPESPETGSIIVLIIAIVILRYKATSWMWVLIAFLVLFILLGMELPIAIG